MKWAVAVERGDAKKGDLPAGMGVLLGTSHVITCAHVVNAALGRDLSCSIEPGDARIKLRFDVCDTGQAPELRLARVINWHAPLSVRRPNDVALLHFSDPILSIAPPRFKVHSGYPRVRAIGPIPGEADWVSNWIYGDIADNVNDGRCQVNRREGKAEFVIPGYSGTGLLHDGKPIYYGIIDQRNPLPNGAAESARFIPTSELTLDDTWRVPCARAPAEPERPNLLVPIVVLLFATSQIIIAGWLYGPGGAAVAILAALGVSLTTLWRIVK